MKSFSELTSASQVNNGDLLAISQTSGSGYASKKTTVKDITDKSNLNLAEEYDSTSTYAVDDYVIYESVLYKCIASTTGAFDSTKWTSVVVTDEMGSGGGGTGGHTIIDENGNSMTARAGLQFVGGANVSDDSTNNKTIVDLASAGGIDGVFIDTSNVVKNDFTLDGTTHTWTATEDCIIFGKFIANDSSTASYVSIDNNNVFVTYISASLETFLINVKKGQEVSYRSKSNYSGFTASMTAYGIQTGTTHSKFQPVIYSLEEREIGVWTDGKPLYQKTFIWNPTSTETTIDVSSLNIDKLVKRQGTFTRNSGGTIQQKNLEYRTEDVSNNNYGIQCEIRSTNLLIRISAYTYSEIIEVRVTIQYTKTTDVAGSGTWTPQGVPAHHYSTDEHIVGTWMGETLWEKTYDFSSNPISIPSSSNFMTSDIDSSNMGVITNVFANHSDGTLYNDMSADPTGNNHTKLKLKSVGGATAYYLTLQYTKSS